MQATQESWDAPRRYRDFTQLRKRLLRLGVDIPTLAATREGARSTGAEPLSVDLPKKTWRANKFDKDHLAARRAALETYLQAAVEVGGNGLWYLMFFLSVLHKDESFFFCVKTS